MDIINIKNNDRYLTEYIKLCNLEWGSKKTKKELDKYVEEKLYIISNEDKVITVLVLVDNNIMVGFISLFKYDGDQRKDLTPWYATMYVKKEYRGKGYSKLLNDALLKEAYDLGYDKVYLKTELENYYEKFGAVLLDQLDEKEKLYYIPIND